MPSILRRSLSSYLSRKQDTDILPAPRFALKVRGFMVGTGNLTIPLQITYRYLISSKTDVIRVIPSKLSGIRAEFSALICLQPHFHKITAWQPHTAVFIWWCLCLYPWSYWRCTAKHRIPRWVVKRSIPRIGEHLERGRWSVWIIPCLKMTAILRRGIRKLGIPSSRPYHVGNTLMGRGSGTNTNDGSKLPAS